MGALFHVVTTLVYNFRCSKQSMFASTSLLCGFLQCNIRQPGSHARVCCMARSYIRRRVSQFWLIRKFKCKLFLLACKTYGRYFFFIIIVVVVCVSVACHNLGIIFNKLLFSSLELSCRGVTTYVEELQHVFIEK